MSNNEIEIEETKGSNADFITTIETDDSGSESPAESETKSDESDAGSEPSILSYDAVV